LSTVGTYTIQNAKKTTLWYPPKFQEQKKIASCLSSLDEVIAAEMQRFASLRVHKKGLMQNLFPKEGEKVPQYRFKEFEGDGEWVEKKLDDVCKLVRGPFGGALKKEIFVKEGYAVYEQSHAIYGDFSSFRYYIGEDKFNELKRFSVKPGDLIMSCSGTMGKFAIVPNNYKIGIINQALLKLTVKKGYDILFVKMTLEADNNQNKLLSQSAGGAIKNVVSVSQIKELGLLIPSLPEQQKIASCLSSLDALINAQTDKVEQLKWHKKGLMQGLFPKMNE
jgi:type I restriction enzyme, S subunit